MKFFIAQKNLTKLWFIWTGVIVLFLFKEFLGDFKEISNMIMKWVGLYLGPIFTLILSSAFFKREWFEEELKSRLFFYLAFGTSIIYLGIISYCLFILPEQITSDTMNPKSLADQLKDGLDNQGYLLNFIEPIVSGVLGYFFFSNKK